MSPNCHIISVDVCSLVIYSLATLKLLTLLAWTAQLLAHHLRNLDYVIPSSQLCNCEADKQNLHLLEISRLG